MQPDKNKEAIKVDVEPKRKKPRGRGSVDTSVAAQSATPSAAAEEAKFAA